MLQETQTAGLTASQLVRLCQPEQIERTMHLLFALNHWAKARERLFFADRQGLYKVKAALLRQAYEAGQIVARAYIDGTAAFGAELKWTIELAAEMSAETILWQLEKPDGCSLSDTHEQMAARLYTRMTGKEAITSADLEALDIQQVEAYIRARLQALEQEARATRQPIPRDKLKELCVTPAELLGIQDSRFYDLLNWESWDQLDESDLQKLDPEGLSLVAFQYASRSSHYVFHLPFRLAEAFVPAWLIDQLKCAPWTSREHGEYYGRAVTEAESLQQPIADILLELGVDISAICPRQLSDKQEQMFTQALRYAAWAEEQYLYDDVDEYDDDPFWPEMDSPGKKRKHRAPKAQRARGECPLCSASVPAEGPARLDHWQQEHTSQDLTFSQVSWVLDQTRVPGQITGKKQLCQEYPPDYREPHEKGLGTRYWRIETLAERVRESEGIRERNPG